MSDFPLVEPEGVNAGSGEESERADDPPPPEAARGGGDPTRAPSPFAATEPTEATELAGAGEAQEEPSQDAGSNR